MADSAWIQAAMERHEASLLRYANSLLGDLERARDVVQDTFLQLCRQRRQKVADHLAAWLFTVCRRRALDLLRKEQHVKALQEREAAQLTGTTANPHRILEGRETLREVDRLLETLSRDQQEVVRLKFQNGLSYKEISSITRLSVSNVGFLLHTALKKIRDSLDENFDSGIRRVK